MVEFNGALVKHLGTNNLNPATEVGCWDIVQYLTKTITLDMLF